MGYEIVKAGPDDYPAALWPALVAFGEDQRTDEQLEDWRLPYDVMTLYGAKDGDVWLGTVGDYDFELTVPGGTTISSSGLTWVGVLPTHRRQGITRSLMGTMFDDMAERGHVVSVLLAAEAAIYGRFGYGVAAQYATVEIDPANSAYLEPVADSGSLQICDHIEGSRFAEQVWDEYRLTVPGGTNRHWWMWELHRRDREHGRDGGSPRYWVVHRRADGTPDGFATWRMKPGEKGGLAHYRAVVTDLTATTPEVEAVLFRFLCDLDLVRELEVTLRPVDEPLRWRLADPRQLKVTELGDFLWLRVLDVEAAFSARSYPVADELTVEVTDEFRPASGGRFAITAEPDGSGTCRRTETAADLELDTSTLASLLLGTVSASTLAAAGRIVEAVPGALGRADRLFASTPVPFAATEF